jgi:4-hydroxybenzoate polyprenyltransferase
VRSTALLFGDRSRLVLSAFAFVFCAMMIWTGVNNYDVHSISEATARWPYFASVFAATSHLLYQVNAVDYNNPKQCFKFFDSNKWVGLIILAGIIGANYLARHDKQRSPNFEKKQELNRIHKQEEAKKSMLDRVKETLSLISLKS